MSEPEKNEYVKVQAEKIARLNGIDTIRSVPEAAIKSIRNFLSGYVGRIRAARVDNCSPGVYMRSDMTSVLERASPVLEIRSRERNLRK